MAKLEKSGFDSAWDILLIRFCYAYIFEGIIF